MIHSVSGVSFRGDAAVNMQDLINSPGKYTSQALNSEMPADSFENNTEKPKSHKGAVIGTIIGLLAAAYIGLGVAVNKNLLKKIDNPEGIVQKTKNFFHKIGESADELGKKVRGKMTEGKSETPKNEGETK